MNGTRKLGGKHAAGNQDPRLWRHRARIELPCARSRLRAHPPRTDARVSDPWRRLSDCGRHRLPLEPDHGDAGHARVAVPREHDRESAFQAWRAHGRRPLRAAHPPAHRPCRQGRSLSHEFDRGRQSARARIFRLRPHASPISGARHQAFDRPLARQERVALPRPRNQRPDRTDAWRLLRGGGRAYRRVDERARSHRRGRGDDLRRRPLRHQRPGRGAVP